MWCWTRRDGRSRDCGDTHTRDTREMEFWNVFLDGGGVNSIHVIVLTRIFVTKLMNSCTRNEITRVQEMKYRTH